jgi:hypothetical protein
MRLAAARSKAGPFYEATEHQVQVALIDWVDVMCRTAYPQLRWLFAVPNGGLRHPAVANYMKAEGLRAGVPDLVLPVPVEPWHGAYLEMKRAAGELTPRQAEWREHLIGAGYSYCMARSFEQARDFLISYLKGA